MDKQSSIDSFQKKNNRLSSYVPVHRRNEEDDVKHNKFRSSTNATEIQVETSTSTKRSSLMGRRPPSINNRYSRNSFIGDDDIEYYVSHFKHFLNRGN